MKKVFLVKSPHLKQREIEKVPLYREIVRRVVVVENPLEAEAVFVLGGDGAMFQAVRAHKALNIPFFGFNFGHIGFLLNPNKVWSLREILRGDFELVKPRLLLAKVYDEKGKLIATETAFNDCYFERAGTQTARVRISVTSGNRRGNPVEIESLTCDGVIVATPAGSTAYNAAAGGMILPIDSNSLVVTGIAPAIFQHWRSSQLPEKAVIRMRALELEKRPVRFLADGYLVEGAVGVEIKLTDDFVRLGFAASQDYHEKVMNLQFLGK